MRPDARAGARAEPSASATARSQFLACSDAIRGGRSSADDPWHSKCSPAAESIPGGGEDHGSRLNLRDGHGDLSRAPCPGHAVAGQHSLRPLRVGGGRALRPHELPREGVAVRSRRRRRRLAHSAPWRDVAPGRRDAAHLCSLAAVGAELAHSCDLGGPGRHRSLRPGSRGGGPIAWTGRAYSGHAQDRILGGLTGYRRAPRSRSGVEARSALPGHSHHPGHRGVIPDRVHHGAVAAAASR